jgi:uncharacterized protein
VPVTKRGGAVALPMLALGALTLIPLGQVVTVVGAIGLLLAGAVTVLGVRTRCWPAVRVAVLGLLLAAIGVTGLPFGLWWATAVVALLATRTESLRPRTGWLPSGKSSTVAQVLTATTVVLAPIVLVAWLSTGPQLGEATIRLVEAAREASWLAIGVFVAIFVMVNAVVEEVVYRQVVYEAARSVLSPAPAVIVQAAAFATLHVEGFPAGLAGVGLAFLYGMALGVIRSLTGGLRLPIAAHIVADATIVLLVLTVVL